MSFRNRPTLLRLSLAAAATALLGAAYWQSRVPQTAVKAAPDDDPNTIWSIGKADGAGDEFGAGAAPKLAYQIGKHTPRDWKQRQDAARENTPVYAVRFAAGQTPAAAELVLDCFFLGPAPSALELRVNGKRGRFRVQPVEAQNIDERQSNSPAHSRQSFRIPLAASLFRPGDNEVAMAWIADSGSVWYDAAALRKAPAPPELAATVEPTIFFRRAGERVTETTEVVLRHFGPLADATVSLALNGSAAITAKAPAEDLDFGERVVTLEVPAPAAPRPYSLAVSAGAAKLRTSGEFRPEKRWRIFAGLKIHNDIGFTDLQPHVQELDNRNTDGVLDIAAKHPLYKFNFETSWLVENYIHSRSPARVKQFMAQVARNQVGVNAMYLNLMTGISTGEELYRSLYYSKDLERRYGVPMKFACLTDAPSHTWFVPTLLADTGVPGFALGSNQARAPLLQNSRLNEDSPFWWEGPDGKRVMAWFARSYLQLDRLVGRDGDVATLRRSVPQFLARYRRGEYPVDAVLLYGLFTDNADIRHGNAAVLEEWNKTYAYPKIIPALDSDYYAYLKEKFGDKLPTFKGDAGAYWEDGAGSSAAETAINRDSQRLLPVAEMAAAFATWLHPEELYPADEFRDAWKNLMFYDEHTWGASHAISQPERERTTAQWEFKRAYAMRARWAAQDLAYRSFNRLAQNIGIDGPTLYIFNPDLWTRTDSVRVEIEPGREFVDLATGAAVPAVELFRKDHLSTVRFLARDVPGLGYKAYAVRNVPAKPAPAVRRDSWQIESRYYRVVFDRATGAIAQLIDKELNRNLVDARAPYKLNELLYVAGGEGTRMLHDNLTLAAAKLNVSGQSGAQLVSSGAGRLVVRAAARNFPEIETEVTVYDDLKRVDIVNRLRKQETRAKEAVYFAFPFAVSPPELAYQVQNVWIRPNTDQLPGACREWFTTQNVVTARDAGAVIAWATPDAPLITLADINRGLWLKQLNVANGHVFSYAMNNYWFTNYKAAQGGEFTFRYFITSARSLDEAALARFDVETRSPLVAYDQVHTGNARIVPAKRRMPAAAGAFLKVDAGNAQVSAFKPAEDGNGFILRLRETAGRKGTARVESPIFPLAGAALCNGVEDRCTALAVRQNAFEAPLAPHQYATVRLMVAKGPVARR